MNKVPSHKDTPLDEVLKYKNDDVIYRLLDSYNLSFEEAEDIFTELKKWLWLCAQAQNEGFNGLVVKSDLFMLDEMWHAFILFTNDYNNFCTYYLGRYIHHAPVRKSERAITDLAKDTDMIQYTKIEQEKYDELCSYIYDKLGIETLNKWYLDFPKKYTPDYLKKIRKWKYS